jgi:small subunit ribosomal protein S4
VIIMGKPKFSRKKYDTPSHPWQEQRIHSENELVRKYGLKNKREIWKAETALRKYRGQARELLAKVGGDDPQEKKEVNQLLTHLTRYNILPLNSTLDDVLALETEAILARRLQTLTYLKGLANTPKQARQLIVQGHIAIGDNRITIPSYRISKKEENEIDYAPDSPLNDLSHPARPSADFKSKLSKTMLGDESKKEAKPLEKQAKSPEKKKPKDKKEEAPKEPVEEKEASAKKDTPKEKPKEDVKKETKEPKQSPKPKDEKKEKADEKQAKPKQEKKEPEGN